MFVSGTARQPILLRIFRWFRLSSLSCYRVINDALGLFHVCPIKPYLTSKISLARRGPAPIRPLPLPLRFLPGAGHSSTAAAVNCPRPSTAPTHGLLPKITESTQSSWARFPAAATSASLSASMRSAHISTTAPVSFCAAAEQKETGAFVDACADRIQADHDAEVAASRKWKQNDGFDGPASSARDIGMGQCTHHDSDSSNGG